MPSMIKKSLAQYGDQIGYDIGYQDLSLSPLRLRVEINGLHLAKNRGNNLLGLKKLVVSLKWSRILMGEFGLDEVLLEEPRILLEKNVAKGASPQAALWNWQELIHAVEKHDRSLYSGYLGPVHVDEETHLFVNLRTVRLTQRTDGVAATYFAGCGITEESNPAKEWQETEMKCQTLQRVLSASL